MKKIQGLQALHEATSLGNHQNFPNCIYMIQKMKLKIELVQLGKLCFLTLFALNGYMPVFIQLSQR